MRWYKKRKCLKIHEYFQFSGTEKSSHMEGYRVSQTWKIKIFRFLTYDYQLFCGVCFNYMFK